MKTHNLVFDVIAETMASKNKSSEMQRFVSALNPILAEFGGHVGVRFSHQDRKQANATLLTSLVIDMPSEEAALRFVKSREFEWAKELQTRSFQSIELSGIEVRGRTFA